MHLLKKGAPKILGEKERERVPFYKGITPFKIKGFCKDFQRVFKVFLVRLFLKKP
jgi:hypothetical protein